MRSVNATIFRFHLFCSLRHLLKTLICYSLPPGSLPHTLPRRPCVLCVCVCVHFMEKSIKGLCVCSTPKTVYLTSFMCANNGKRVDSDTAHALPLAQGCRYPPNVNVNSNECQSCKTKSKLCASHRHSVTHIRQPNILYCARPTACQKVVLCVCVRIKWYLNMGIT